MQSCQTPILRMIERNVIKGGARFHVLQTSLLGKTGQKWERGERQNGWAELLAMVYVFTAIRCHRASQGG